MLKHHALKAHRVQGGKTKSSSTQHGLRHVVSLMSWPTSTPGKQSLLLIGQDTGWVLSSLWHGGNRNTSVPAMCNMKNTWKDHAILFLSLLVRTPKSLDGFGQIWHGKSILNLILFIGIFSWAIVYFTDWLCFHLHVRGRHTCSVKSIRWRWFLLFVMWEIRHADRSLFMTSYIPKRTKCVLRIGRCSQKNLIWAVYLHMLSQNYPKDSYQIQTM
jgi:hypothetical protein